jgi:hypothetical protein
VFLEVLGPLDVKPNAGAKSAIGAELGLVGVALEQAGGERVEALKIEPMRQHLADLAGPRGVSRRYNTEQQQSGDEL